MIKKYPINVPSEVKHGIIPVDGNNQLTPGVEVYQSGYSNSRGIIVSIVDNEIIVLWSIEPTMGSVAKLVSRTFPSILAKNIVSVQPMPKPNGITFYLDYKYGEN